MARHSHLYRYFALVLFLFFFPVLAQASFGDADNSFGSAGIVTDTALNYEPTAMTRQSDGKIVTVGRRYDAGFGAWELVVRRYLANGTVDTAFGTNGKAIAYNTGGWPRDVAIQADGKIVAVGVSPSSNVTAVWRFNSNGWYDTTFGTNGRVVTWGNGLCDLAVIKSGVGVTNDLIIGCRSGELFRLMPNGSIRTTFGSGGLVDVNTLIYSTAVKGGSIYLLGAGTIRKYSLNGVADSTFGTGGLFDQQSDYSCLVPYPSNGEYESIERQSNGTLIVFGRAKYNLSNYFAPHLSGHTSNGSFDPTFMGLPCAGTSNFSYQGFVYAPTVKLDGLDRIILASSNSVERRLQNGVFDDSYTLSAQTIADVEVLSDNRVLTLASKTSGGVTRARLTQVLP